MSSSYSRRRRAAVSCRASSRRTAASSSSPSMPWCRAASARSSKGAMAQPGQAIRRARNSPTSAGRPRRVSSRLLVSSIGVSVAMPPCWAVGGGPSIRAGAPIPKPSKLRPDLPPSFDPWFARALDRDVNKRFQTAKEFATSLATALKPSDLSRTLMLSPAGMTSRLDRLEQAGFVDRRMDPDDRRSFLVRLNDVGRAKVDAAVTDHVAREDALLGTLSRREREALDDLLRRLVLSIEP